MHLGFAASLLGEMNAASINRSMQHARQHHRHLFIPFFDCPMSGDRAITFLRTVPLKFCSSTFPINIYLTQHCFVDILLLNYSISRQGEKVLYYLPSSSIFIGYCSIKAHIHDRHKGPQTICILEACKEKAANSTCVSCLLFPGVSMTTSRWVIWPIMRHIRTRFRHLSCIRPFV